MAQFEHDGHDLDSNIKAARGEEGCLETALARGGLFGRQCGVYDRLVSFACTTSFTQQSVHRIQLIA
jgi:hypothetical protein